jgi:hypothetical protein
MQFVQATAKFESSSSVDSITSAAFGSQPAVDNYIIVVAWAGFTGNDPSPFVFSDNQGNTYAVAVTSPLTSSNNVRSAIGYAKIATSSGSFTVTVDPNTTTQFITAQAWEVSGLAASTPLDQTNTAAGTSTSPTSGSVTTTQADEILVAAFSDLGTGNSAITAPGAPWVDQFEEENGALFVRGSGQYQIVAATGTYSATWTSAGAEWTGCIASFKAEATGAFSLTADSGSYAVTGTVAGLRATRLLTAEAGTYAITGTAAALLAERLLTADGGTYVITGTSANLVYTPVGGSTNRWAYTRKRRR